MADIETSNGVLHTINRLLFPPPKFADVLLSPDAEVEDTLRAPATATATASAPAPTASTKEDKPKLTIGFKPTNEDK